MHVAILDDYQDCVRSLACFSRLAGHRVTVAERGEGGAELAHAYAAWTVEALGLA